VAGEAAQAGRGLGKLQVFEGVREYPSRVKCASLAWHALRTAIADEPPR
jgi:nitrogen fixation NifU-like protein